MAAKLAGQRVILSHTNKPLFITTCEVDILKQVPLPANIEDLFKAPTTPTSTPNVGLASVFNKNPAPAAPANTNANDEKKYCYATKELFRQLAAHLKLSFADQTNDIFIFEVVPDPVPQDVASSILNNGDALTDVNKEKELIVTFGFQKKFN